jgi:RimJ/RimL family protein N-acetyltransferase
MILETERLTLSLVRATDAPFILKLLNDPTFIQHIRYEGIHTLDEARAHIRVKYTCSYQTNGFGMYLVTLKSSSEQVGLCGIVKRDALDCPDIGYAFLAEHSGKGYASESANAVMQYGVHNLGIGRIVGITSIHNHGSIKILEKVGLVFSKMISTEDGETMLFVQPSLDV